MSKYLTKSRFTLAVTCPTKLWYYGNPGYVDNSNEDEFLKMLAEGGFQVGELAKVMFPGGIYVPAAFSIDDRHEASPTNDDADGIGARGSHRVPRL